MCVYTCVRIMEIFIRVVSAKKLQDEWCVTKRILCVTSFFFSFDIHDSVSFARYIDNDNKDDESFRTR